MSPKWYFDTAAGEREIVARRIGRNELLAIDAASSIGKCRGALRPEIHACTHRRSSAVRDRQDGLHWEVPQDQTPSPLGRLGDFAEIAVSSAVTSTGVRRICFPHLAAQGDEAKGGAKNYITGGKMTGGFAVIATPVKYQRLRNYDVHRESRRCCLPERSRNATRPMLPRRSRI